MEARLNSRKAYVDGRDQNLDAREAAIADKEKHLAEQQTEINQLRIDVQKLKHAPDDNQTAPGGSTYPEKAPPFPCPLDNANGERCNHILSLANDGFDLTVHYMHKVSNEGQEIVTKAVSGAKGKFADLRNKLLAAQSQAKSDAGFIKARADLLAKQYEPLDNQPKDNSLDDQDNAQNTLEPLPALKSQSIYRNLPRGHQLLVDSNIIEDDDVEMLGYTLKSQTAYAGFPMSDDELRALRYINDEDKVILPLAEDVQPISTPKIQPAALPSRHAPPSVPTATRANREVDEAKAKKHGPNVDSALTGAGIGQRAPAEAVRRARARRPSLGRQVYRNLADDTTSADGSEEIEVEPTLKKVGRPTKASPVKATPTASKKRKEAEEVETTAKSTGGKAYGASPVKRKQKAGVSATPAKKAGRSKAKSEEVVVTARATRTPLKRVTRSPAKKR